MPFTERLRAERAFDAIDTDRRPLDWPSAAGRIRDARSTVGLEESEIARRLGISLGSYSDLEAYDDEAFTVPTLRHLVMLGAIVGVDARVLLLGSEAKGIEHGFTFGDIVQRLARRLTEDRMTPEQMGNRIGFAVDRALTSPDALWDYDVEGLYNICKTLDIDWVAAIPTAPPDGLDKVPGNSR
jgi:hypothetical protein